MGLQTSDFGKTLFNMSTIRICNNPKNDFSGLMSKPGNGSQLVAVAKTAEIDGLAEEMEKRELANGGMEL